MNSKSRSPIILVTTLLALALLAAVVFYASRPQSLVLADAIGSQNFPSLGETLNQPPLLSGATMLAQTKNGVTVEITSAKIIETVIEIGVCFTTIDAGEWYLVPGHLLYDKYELFPDESEYTAEQKADSDQVGKQCVLTRYLIDDLQSITTPVQFSIEEIIAHPREMYSLCQDFEQRLTTNSTAQASGLKADCTEKSDGSLSVTLVDHAKSVSSDAANKLLDEIASYRVEGPWEFTITEFEE